MCSTDASSVAETSVSRFRRAIAGFEYFAATISPCSVRRIEPSTEPGGSARIASYAGPPPRPTLPASSVEEPQPHPGRVGDGPVSAAWAADRLHCEHR